MRLQLHRTHPIGKRIFILFAALSIALQSSFCSTLISNEASAQTVSHEITQAVLTNLSSIAASNTPIELSIQLKNSDGAEQPTDSVNTKLSLTSSSRTGLFARGDATPADWTTAPGYDIDKNVASKSFFYKDATPGAHTITAKVSGGNIKNTISVSTTVTVAGPTAPPIVHPAALTLTQRVAAASPGDTVDVIGDEMVTGTIIVDKELTLTSSNGSTLFTSGQSDLFHITAPDVVISNLKFTKNDSLDQRIITISASNATISGNVFKGQYVRDIPEATRALEISAGAGHVVIGNTITDFYEAVYGGSDSSGQISNNFIANTRGWVLQADTDFDLSGNMFGENDPDIAIVVGSSNNYTCERLRSIFLNNNKPKIYSQMLDITACDMTVPAEPPIPPEEKPIIEPEETPVVITPVTSEDTARAQQELLEQIARLSAPFVLPGSFAPVEASPAPSVEGGGDVLGDQMATASSTDRNAKTVAVAATESGWKLFGILWQWWLILFASLGYFTYRIATRRADPQDV